MGCFAEWAQSVDFGPTSSVTCNERAKYFCDYKRELFYYSHASRSLSKEALRLVGSLRGLLALRDDWANYRFVRGRKLIFGRMLTSIFFEQIHLILLVPVT